MPVTLAQLDFLIPSLDQRARSPIGLCRRYALLEIEVSQSDIGPRISFNINSPATPIHMRFRLSMIALQNGTKEMPVCTG